jgi:hypothetical protein
MSKKVVQSSKKVHNWSNNPLKNKFIEPVRQGLCLFANYDVRKPLIYQDQLFKVEQDAETARRRIWK